MTKKWLVRFGWMAVGVAALYAVSALADSALGGPLDPPGAPSSTMKTLDEIPSTWSRLLGASGADSCNTARFTCVLGGQAVRDNETGLVWERQPSTAPATWSVAVRVCADNIKGGRGGWRVPTDPELRSLLDPAGSSQPILPDGHPFIFGGPFGLVWTMSPVPNETDHVYSVDVDTLDRDPTDKTTAVHAWCVRGVQADAHEGSALAEEPPAWYRTLDPTGGCFSERFRCVLNDEAVLDRETGLVWQRDGSTTSASWFEAVTDCYQALVGGRYGWRLPTWPEAMTLASSSSQLVSPSPFTNIFPGGPGGSLYWTSTAEPTNLDAALVISWGYFGGAVSKTSGAPGVTGRSLCVRAGESIATD